MKVVTIGDGLMARAIKEVLPETVILGHDAIEVTSQDSIVRAFREHQPDLAIYCAATHRLSECEAQPAQAFEVNARGADRVARLVPTIYLSSDYVHSDGGPHDETLPGRQPRSVYGRSKFAGELATLEQDGIVVRISGVYHGSIQSRKGISFPEMVARSYDPLRLPSDQVFSPTYAPDAAERIVMLAQRLASEPLVPEGVPFGGPHRPTGIYHAANAGSVSWADFATHIRKRMGRPRMKVVGFAANDPLRPKNSALRSTRLMPLRSWIEAVDAWMIARQRHLEETRTVSPLRGNA